MTTFYAQKAPDGRVTGVGHMAMDLADDVLSAMGAVRLSAEQHAELQADPTHWVHQDGTLTKPGAEVQLLDEARAWAALAIDDAAEQARLCFLTPGSGQALEYSATQADAERLLAAAGEPDPMDYPWVEAERQAQAAAGASKTLVDVAQAIVAQQAAWVQAGAAIKAIRRTAKLQVAAAGTAADVQAIVQAVTWPTPPA